MVRYDRKRLGLHLKAAREKAGISQGEIAKKVGYTTPQLISNIERGVCVAPIETLARMATIYKSPANQIAKIILESQERYLVEKLGGKRGARSARTQ